MQKVNDRLKKAGMLVLIAFYTVCYFSLLFNRNVWTDEAFTIELIRENGWSQIWSATAEDVHPPLYYYIVKLFVSLLGDSFFTYKLVSVVPMLLILLLAFTKIRKLAGYDAGVIFVVFLNAVPCVLEYVIQIRMYSWAMFFVTWAGLDAYEMCIKGRGRYAAGLTIAAMLACYTHNYAMLSCVYIYILTGIFAVKKWIQEKNKGVFVQWLISGVFVAVCYIPWLLVLYQQTTSRIGNYWITEVTAASLVEYMQFLFGSYIPYSAVMFGILCVFACILCVINIKKGNRLGIAGLLACSVPVAVAAVGIAVSVLVTPFFIARYLLPCLGLFAVLFAMAFHRENAVVKLLACIFGFVMFFYSWQANYEIEYRSTHTEELLAYLDENMGERDYIVYNYEIYGFIYEIYFDKDRTVFLNDMDFSQDFDTVWYFDSCVTPWISSQLLEDNGLKKEFVANMGIEQNDFALYRIVHN